VTELGLTFYDAAYAAVARRRGHALVTADGRLLDAGLGISAPDAMRSVARIHDQGGRQEPDTR
jgi:hypothetical protein